MMLVGHRPIGGIVLRGGPLWMVMWMVVCAVGDLMGIEGGGSEESEVRLARCATVHGEAAVRGSSRELLRGESPSHCAMSTRGVTRYSRSDCIVVKTVKFGARICCA
jgi:hypothetical protein